MPDSDYISNQKYAYFSLSAPNELPTWGLMYNSDDAGKQFVSEVRTDLIREAMILIRAVGPLRPNFVQNTGQ